MTKQFEVLKNDVEYFAKCAFIGFTAHFVHLYDIEDYPHKGLYWERLPEHVKDLYRVAVSGVLDGMFYKGYHLYNPYPDKPEEKTGMF